MENDTRNHLLVTRFFLGGEFQDVFIQSDDRRAESDVL